MRIAAYVASTIASVPEVVAGAMTGDVAIEGVFSHPLGEVPMGTILTGAMD